MQAVTIKKFHIKDIRLLDNIMPESYLFEGVTKEMRPESDTTYLMAYAGKKCVGHVSIYWEGIRYPKNNQNKAYPELVGIKVDKAFRRQGVGTKLVREVEKHCIENGFSKYCLVVSPSNKIARQFYKKLGFSEPKNKTKGNLILEKEVNLKNASF